MADQRQDEWTPDQPLSDKEMEEEAQTRARGQARTDFLRDQYKDKTKGGKKKTSW